MPKVMERATSDAAVGGEREVEGWGVSMLDWLKPVGG